MALIFSASEHQMNLSVLQNKDPLIIKIEDTASQVAAYSFNSLTNEWEKTNIEGTLFVYSRSASPTHGFTIMNRLHPSDLVEPINKNLEFQLQDPFLLYRNSKAAIFGIWFYDQFECARIGQLMNSLAQVASEDLQTRKALENDSDKTVVSKGALDNTKQPVNILQMLSKAQDEFDKTRQWEQTYNTTSSNIDKDLQHPTATHISLDVLFKKAQLHNSIQSFDQKLIGGGTNSAFHLPATSIHKQPTPTVEQIEREHLSENTGAGVVVESPNSTLKRDLNINKNLTNNHVLNPTSFINVTTVMSQITNPSTSFNHLEKTTLTPTKAIRSSEKKASTPLSPSNHPTSNSLVQALFSSHQKHSSNNINPSQVDVSKDFPKLPFNSYKQPSFPPFVLSPPASPVKASISNGEPGIYPSWIKKEKSSPTLISPFAFKTNSKTQLKKKLPLLYTDELNKEIINKENLKHTLIDLLNTDETFLTAIHQAYIKNVSNSNCKANMPNQCTLLKTSEL